MQPVPVLEWTGPHGAACKDPKSEREKISTHIAPLPRAARPSPTADRKLVKHNLKRACGGRGRGRVVGVAMGAVLAEWGG